MVTNDISLIALLSFFIILPFVVAGGTCFIKFSIVFIMVRNALGVQQVPSTLTLNGIAMILTAFIMMPICQNISNYINNNHIDFNDSHSINNLMDHGLDSYRHYLVRYSDHKLIAFFYKVQQNRENSDVKSLVDDQDLERLSLMTLLPAYALSEIQAAFKIAFYLYIPFVVIDMIVSSILLALGMMMMSPVTISIPIKLILFVVMNGWTLLTKGLILQYSDLVTS